MEYKIIIKYNLYECFDVFFCVFNFLYNIVLLNRNVFGWVFFDLRCRVNIGDDLLFLMILLFEELLLLRLDLFWVVNGEIGCLRVFGFWEFFLEGLFWLFFVCMFRICFIGDEFLNFGEVVCFGVGEFDFV